MQHKFKTLNETLLTYPSNPSPLPQFGGKCVDHHPDRESMAQLRNYPILDSVGMGNSD